MACSHAGISRFASASGLEACALCSCCMTALGWSACLGSYIGWFGAWIRPCCGVARRCSTWRRRSTRTSRAGTLPAFRQCMRYAPCHGMQPCGHIALWRRFGPRGLCALQLLHDCAGLVRMPRLIWGWFGAWMHPCCGAARRCSIRRRSTRTSRAGTRRAFRTCLTYAHCHGMQPCGHIALWRRFGPRGLCALQLPHVLRSTGMLRLVSRCGFRGCSHGEARSRCSGRLVTS